MVQIILQWRGPVGQRCSLIFELLLAARHEPPNQKTRIHCLSVGLPSS